ncbi:response regulator transcription factor [Halarcobacter anaerophilus]|uniref:DNA-binding response regulator n=1 Tax=Halarcobacter anaerophilus TaxID=877500 RepID=A0A4Q0XYQ2_9BACT|nr:response regulator [Halarcobacter anaerophilus]QDF28719.1 two-component system response regulator [Halarcobacter anaerophilus]RXJ61914.1 DNA-binding response regulator [Halarcobacter anaerophilus]
MNRDLYPYKILFIEDEELLRKNYTDYLKMNFSEVIEAKDGQEGLDLYKKYKPDILIVDINIPRIDGLKLLEMIRINDIETKAIILTAHVDKDFLLRAASLKLVKYLEKPVNRKNLKDALLLAINEISTYSITNKKIVELKEELLWNNELKELIFQNKNIELTNKEKLLLELLTSHANKVFSYDEIFFHVWNNYNEEASFSALKNLIRRIRKKLPENTILNIFNEGYKINRK